MFFLHISSLPFIVQKQMKVSLFIPSNLRHLPSSTSKCHEDKEYADKTFSFYLLRALKILYKKIGCMYIYRGQNKKNQQKCFYHISNKRLLIFRSSLRAVVAVTCPFSTKLALDMFSTNPAWTWPRSCWKTDSITCTWGQKVIRTFLFVIII